MGPWNAFSQGEPLKLHVEITTDACAPDHHRWFVLLSKAPSDAAIWDPLRDVRGRSRCGEGAGGSTAHAPAE